MLDVTAKIVVFTAKKAFVAAHLISNYNKNTHVVQIKYATNTHTRTCQ